MTKGEICEFSAIPFSLQLMFDKTLSNLVVCLMISQNMYIQKYIQNKYIQKYIQNKYIQKLHKRASVMQWILGRFVYSQNETENETSEI